MRQLIPAIALVLAMPMAVQAATWQTATISGSITGQLRTLIQAEHVRVCGKKLDSHPQLKWAARFKAMDMGYRDRMSHAFIDGKRIWDFYAQAGIPWTYGAGEIIAVNTFPLDVTARVAFDG